MPRKPRFYLPDIPVHVVQRGNARQAVFFDRPDYCSYLDWLHEGADRYGCAVHAYVLMTNHVHLLLTPRSTDSISRAIQHVGRKYVTYVNQRHRRSGTLWEGRHKGSVIHSERYALACYRYIEMNPVRAGMVSAPVEYPWSSYHANAMGKGPKWLTALPEYRRLGADDQTRRRAYRTLFAGCSDVEELTAIRACVQSGTPLGDQVFRERLQARLGLRVGQDRRGRPARGKDDA